MSKVIFKFLFVLFLVIDNIVILFRILYFVKTNLFYKIQILARLYNMLLNSFVFK